MEKLKLYGRKSQKKEEFLGTMYVNQKKEIVIDVKDSQIKKDISQEINREFREHNGVLWPKMGYSLKIMKELHERFGTPWEELEKVQEEYNQELREKLKRLRKKVKSLLKKDKALREYLNSIKDLWKELFGLIIKEEKLLNKKNGLKWKEIDEVKEKRKECEKKIKEKELEGEFYDKLLFMVEPPRHSILLHILTALGEGFGIEKPGSPLFLAALRNHLRSDSKKYGGYVLEKRMPIVEED